MVKKMSRVSRPAPRTVETDVVTRVSAHDISHRAYQRFQKRGREHGHDIDDWLVAEAELLKAGIRPGQPASVQRQKRRLQRGRSLAMVKEFWEVWE